MSRYSPDSRLRAQIETVREAGLLEQLTASRFSPTARSRIANVLGIPAREATMLRSHIMRRVLVDADSDLFEAPRQHIERELAGAFTGRTIYLPTYRRIERDIEEIFPEFEERVRRMGGGYEPPSLARHSAKHYVDLVSFGMEDVRRTIKKRLNNLRDYSLAKFNALSGLYLRDVIRGNAQEFSEKQILSLSETSLSAILKRVSEEVLSEEDKERLKRRILQISEGAASPPEISDTYLAHYFTLLMDVDTEISEQEAEILEFVSVCNAYLGPSKEIIYDDVKSEIEILDGDGRVIDLSVLSSGEKQVISLFCHLYLDPYPEQIVIIDEPELSLSVPWQKRLLPDIFNSKRCNLLVAVTHSPFIYENELSRAALDLRKFTVFED